MPIMLANGYRVETSSNRENLFAILGVGRFDAFPRGINEVKLDLTENQMAYPRLALEQSRALFFPFPIYFWVSKENRALARRIERGLTLALKDGPFRKLFTTYHGEILARMRGGQRHVIRLNNPNLPAGAAETDTTWWWKQK